MMMIRMRQLRVAHGAFKNKSGLQWSHTALPTHRPDSSLNCLMCLFLRPIDLISICFVIYVLMLVFFFFLVILMLVFVLYLRLHFACLCKWLPIFLVIVEGLPTCFCFVP